MKWIAILALLFIVGCVQSQSPTAAVIAEPSELAITINESAVEIVKEAPVQDISTTRTLIQEYLKEVEPLFVSYGFHVEGGNVYVWNNKQKLVLEEIKPLNKRINNTPIYITEVFSSRATETSEAYCNIYTEEGIERRDFELIDSKCKPFKNNPIAVPFNEYYTKIPFDWYYEFKDETPVKIITAEQTVKLNSGFKSVYPLLIFEKDGKTYRIFIDKKLKIPARIEVAEGSRMVQIYDYSSIFREIKGDDGIIFRKIIESDVMYKNVTY